MSVELIIILDKSGSMQKLANDTIGGFNKFIEDQKADKTTKANVSLITFSEDYNTPFYRKDVNEIPDLNRETYVPSGGTALLDAIGHTLPQFANAFQKSGDVDGVMVIIMTDGEENSSRSFKKDQIKEMIKGYENSGWKFIYMGANQDAFHEGGQVGLVNTRGFAATGQGVRNAYDTLSLSATSYRASVRDHKDYNVEAALTDAENKLAAGDTK
jgi:uncharacterized protein YegL